MFVTDPDDVPEDATPFDMRGVDLCHHDGDCSFETILRRYDLTDPVLWRIAAIVHEADLEDDRYDAPEAPGLRPHLPRPVHGRSDEDSAGGDGGADLRRVDEYLRRALLAGGHPHDP